MLIPLGTDQPRRRPTVITWWLMGTNIAIHLAMTIIERFDPTLHDAVLSTFWLAMGPQGGETASLVRAELHMDGSFRFHPWAVFTYQFFHGGLLHLLGNMLFLFVFGPPIEDRFRRAGFLAFYLLGGAFAGLAHLWLDGETIRLLDEHLYIVAPVIGASGSIAAVTGAFIVLFPLVGVRVLCFLIIVGIFTVPAWWLIILGVCWDLLLMSGSGGNIAHMAHLAGYGFGFAVAWSLRASNRIAREPYDLFSLFRQAKRRREFKEIATRGHKSPWLHDAGTPVRSDGRNRHERHGSAVGEVPTPQASQAATGCDELASRRASIAAALSEGRIDEAVRDYERLLDDEPGTMLHREAQLDLANALFARSRYQAALLAYRLLLPRASNAREADEIRLLIALINARYLNDPLEAQRVLAQINADGLDEAQRRLLGTLRAELG